MHHCRSALLALMTACAVLNATHVSAADAQRTRTPKRGQTLDVSVTAYCIDGETASGVETRRGIVAADPSVLPLGTVIRLSGLKRYNGRYTVQDTGRAIKGNDVDIYLPECAAARKFGRQEGRARVIRLGKPDTPRPEPAPHGGVN